jgi:hypothetical protein
MTREGRREGLPQIDAPFRLARPRAGIGLGHEGP